MKIEFLKCKQGSEQNNNETDLNLELVWMFGMIIKNIIVAKNNNIIYNELNNNWILIINLLLSFWEYLKLPILESFRVLGSKMCKIDPLLLVPIHEMSKLKKYYISIYISNRQ